MQTTLDPAHAAVGDTDVTRKAAEHRPARSSSWRALRHSDFRRYFIGTVFSNFGTWLQNTAQMLLAYKLTGSVMAVGIVTCAQFSSVLVLGPWAGMLADRAKDRRRLLIWTQSGSALVALGLAIFHAAGWLDQRMLIVGALLIGLSYTFSLPMFNAIIPTLVPEEDTKAAMAMNTVSYNLGRAVAPVIGVAVVVFIGFTWAFVLNAVSFVILAMVLWMVRPGVVERPQRPSRLMDGFRLALRDRKILLLLVMVSFATVATDPPNVLGPALAAEEFGHAPGWAGCFIAALGLGNVLGAFVPTRNISLESAGWYVGGLGIAMVVFSSAPWLWLSIAAGVGGGVAALLAGAATQTMLLQRAGPFHAGQVMAVWAIAFAGSRPIASVLDALLASATSIRFAGVAFAFPALLIGVAAVCMRLLPALTIPVRRILTGPQEAIATSNPRVT
ncbi:MFS transporter [Actinomadura alba]|uniref:MFS transporter n=1 Tax=Actinomadura alba TaxID=406431 RepID=A0ABR7LVC4_9ACTN|nr:MFS transporter [Actinomadura alba]MBC6468524.1 MFS transporter [Actinomadura alba]